MIQTIFSFFQKGCQCKEKQSLVQSHVLMVYQKIKLMVPPSQSSAHGVYPCFCSLISRNNNLDATYLKVLLFWGFITDFRVSKILKYKNANFLNVFQNVSECPQTHLFANFIGLPLFESYPLNILPGTQKIVLSQYNCIYNSDILSTNYICSCCHQSLLNF